MKIFQSPRSLFAAAVAAALTLPGSAAAQTNAYDDAFHYTRGTNWSLLPTVTGLLNGGFGFTQWVLATNATVSNPGGGRGYFTTRNGTPLPAISSPINSSSMPGQDNAAHVWGLFANGSGINTTVAYRGFSNSLSTTVVFKLDWENLGIGSSSTKFGGFWLRNGNATNGTSDYATGQRFAFYYIGGGTDSFVYWDGNGPQSIGIKYAANPLSCEFTLEAGDTYRLVVKSLNTGSILAILDGQPLLGSGTIDSLALIANQTDGNQNFNRMRILSTSLIPPTIINVSPTNGSIYVNPAGDNVSFEVGSVASTMRGSNVTFKLNGVVQTGLAFNTTGPTNQLLVTNTAALGANQLFNASIVVVDDNSNTTTNTFNFNTFLPTNPCIEAEDYNYGAGSFFPNPAPNAYAGLLGSNNIDYLEVDLSGTNLAAVYRPGDFPQILPVTGDPYDHAGFAAAGATDYEIGWTETGEWQNYTRTLIDTNYIIYARAASGGGNGTILVERLADATATTTNQPRAALGTCIIPATGGSKIYSGQMVPLTDFFSNPVQIRFPGTSTLRCTALNNKNYNLNYLMLVPNTNTATLTPYLSAGFPYPSAAGVALDTSISFTIATRQTAVNPASVQLFLNTSNVTSRLTFDNNAAGCVVTCIPATLLAPNSTNTLKAIFSDNAGSPTTVTNSWQFTTANATVTVIPGTDAQPPGSSGGPGFALRLYKVDDAAPTTSTLANAEAELAGTRTNLNTGLPYPNLDPGANGDGSYAETNTINYDITGAATGTPEFNAKSAFPNVPAAAVNNNLAMEALMYLQLTSGSYHFQVRSDDGFKLTAGLTPGNTNLVLGLFDGGRGNGAASDIYFTVTNSGLYPMRLLYYQAGSGGNVEFYSLSNNTPVLINDPANPNSIKAFLPPAAPVTLLSPAQSGGTATFSFQTQSLRTHYVEYKNALTDANWTPLQTITGNGSITNVTDNTASGNVRFYHVRSQ